MKYGSPSLEILRIAEDLDVKLVVMGSQGRGYVKEFFLGSVSQNIARLSPSSSVLDTDKTLNRSLGGQVSYRFIDNFSVSKYYRRRENV